MDEYLHEQVQDALWVLSDMEATFEQWYPQHFDFLPEEEQEHFTPQELQEADDVTIYITQCGGHYDEE